MVEPSPFVHEAFLYGDESAYLERCVPFVEEGIEASEPVLVAVPAEHLRVLRAHLPPVGPDQVRFEPMERLGANPGWIIPAWAEFARPWLDQGLRARGIGEPIWAARSAAELVECARHESLLNVAFQDAAGFTLVCPYDTATLPDEVLAEAHHNHPVVRGGAGPSPSAGFRPGIPPFLSTPLRPAPADVVFVRFDVTDLTTIRDRAAVSGRSAGLTSRRVADLMVVVVEAATNSIRHGGGHGVIGIWQDGDTVACEVRDGGRITDALAGRRRPPTDAEGGRGLWLIQQLSDLVQHRVIGSQQILRARVGPR